MKIGIGIDTGGTCTDAVIYRFTDKKILAYAKTHTTKDDLSRGIGRALSRLPRELVDQAEVLALSTTLATNACVENKGGRAKLVFFGANKSNVLAVGEEYGLKVDQSLIFVDSKTRPSGKVVREPDWEDFRSHIREWFSDCDAVGVVEMFAKKSGANMEKRAKELIREQYDIPVVCGHELFADNNIIKRGASTLLNARLISIISDFVQAVKRALKELDISIPFVIVRSDGSLMTERFARIHPIETLLCGPVASVMGAVELSDETNSIVIDIGGTTTDIAFVKDGVARKVKSGVRIGSWNTFVKGLFVDTFGLGGDSGVVMIGDDSLALEDEKVMPLCMAASRYPELGKHLEAQDRKAALITSQKDDIYIGIRDIMESDNYTEQETAIAHALYKAPKSLGVLGQELNNTILKNHLQRLIREGVILRCGVTPTDVMHVKGDFTKYDAEASLYGIRIMARCMHLSVEELCDKIYDSVKRKLYSNIVRILIEDSNPKLHETGIGRQLEMLIDQTYDRLTAGESSDFLRLMITTPATLVGVGAPTHVFLHDVGRLLDSKVVLSDYSKVANALGAIVGNISAKVTMEIQLDQNTGIYTVYGGGERHREDNLEQAKQLARSLAEQKARAEAISRGAAADVDVSLEEEEDIIETDFGPVYMGYHVTALAMGELDLDKILSEES